MKSLMTEAAELGTRKVIEEALNHRHHRVTTDGTITEIDRPAMWKRKSAL
jgi:hypothetical protein